MDNLEIAENLFASSDRAGDSRRIGSDVAALLEPWNASPDSEERRIELLLKAYNWSGRHLDCFGLAKQAVSSWGQRFVPWLNTALLNAFWWPGDAFLSAVDELIRLKLGDEAFWRLRKADFLQAEATGERYKEEEWMPGDPIENDLAFAQEAEELRRALAFQLPPELVDGWNTRFAPLLAQSKYTSLRPPSSRPG